MKAKSQTGAILVAAIAMLYRLSYFMFWPLAAPGFREFRCELRGSHSLVLHAGWISIQGRVETAGSLAGESKLSLRTDACTSGIGE